jgi:hypothetical protein
MKWKVLLLASSAVLAASAAIGGSESGAQLTDFGRIFTPNKKLTLAAPTATIGQVWPGVTARYYRLRLRVNNPSGKPWSLTFKSPLQQLLSAFDSSQKDCESADGCWTRRLKAESIQVEFAPSDPTISANVLTGLFMPDDAQNPFYSPFADSPIEDFSKLGGSEDERALKIRRSGERLGLLATSGIQNSIPISWCCSGVRLTKELFLTNWHCGAPKGAADADFWQDEGQIEGKSQACGNAVIDMSWDEDGISREFACRGVPYRSKAFDAAILRLGTLPDGDDLTEPFNPLAISSSTPAAGIELRIIQHDACKPKRVARSCNVQRTDVPSWTADSQPSNPTEFSYNCSTEGGSSGSPVFDAASGALVGLHHLGYDVTSPSALKENVGVKIKHILDDIKDKRPALHKEITGQ